MAAVASWPLVARFIKSDRVWTDGLSFHLLTRWWPTCSRIGPPSDGKFNNRSANGTSASVGRAGLFMGVAAACRAGADGWPSRCDRFPHLRPQGGSPEM